MLAEGQLKALPFDQRIIPFPEPSFQRKNKMFTLLRQRLAELIYPEGPSERRSLERGVLTDALTGLGNKRALELALPTAERDPNTSVLIFDMNNLGRANKVDGHRRGDALIRRAGRTLTLLTKKLTGGSRAFRFGGDEFLILTDAAYGPVLAAAIREGFGKHRLSDGTLVSFTGSYGRTFEEADEMLQELKAQHKSEERANG